jgi:hypothetical protein
MHQQVDRDQRSTAGSSSILCTGWSAGIPGASCRETPSVTLCCCSSSRSSRGTGCRPARSRHMAPATWTSCCGPAMAARQTRGSTAIPMARCMPFLSHHDGLGFRVEEDCLSSACSLGSKASSTPGCVEQARRQLQTCCSPGQWSLTHAWSLSQRGCRQGVHAGPSCLDDGELQHSKDSRERCFTT